MSVQIPIDRDRIAAFCRRHHIVELSLFGSVLRDDFGPDSDIDVLVEFDRDAPVTMFGLVGMEDELAHILGRKIDLVMKNGINRWIRREVLQTREPIYAAS